MFDPKVYIQVGIAPGWSQLWELVLYGLQSPQLRAQKGATCNDLLGVVWSQPMSRDEKSWPVGWGCCQQLSKW